MPCTLEFSDERFIYAGKPYARVPLLIDSNFHFVEPVCDYLRDLVISDRLAISSVRTYAEIIQHFWNFLEHRGLDYAEITDIDFHRWLNNMEAKGNKSYVAAQRCDAVFALYCWMEMAGRIEYVVKIPGHNDQLKFIPRLSSRRARSSRYRPSKYGIVWANRPNDEDANQVQHTPTKEDLLALYAAADNPDNPVLTERNHLIIDWYAQVGLRRTEAVHLMVDQIPDWDAIDELRQKRHAYELLLTTTKGGRPRHVGVLPPLLERTREWMEGPRADIVNQFKELKGAAYIAPQEILVSAKTGMRITEKAISNYFTSLFEKSQVKGHGHRIRAYYLQNLIDAEIDAAMAAAVRNGDLAGGIDWELIIQKVAERAGHKDIKSIRKYVTLKKKHYGKIASRDDVVTMAQMLAAQHRELSLLEHRIAEAKANLASLAMRKSD